MQFAKAFVAIVGAGVTAALGIFTEGTAFQILTILSALLTAAGVYLVPNTPPSPEV